MGKHSAPEAPDRLGPCRLIVATCRAQGEADARREFVDAVGVWVSQPRTMSTLEWAGLVQLAGDSNFQEIGQFYPRDVAAIEDEAKAWGVE